MKKKHESSTGKDADASLKDALKSHDEVKDSKKESDTPQIDPLEELTNTLKRAQADFENYKRRTEEQQESFIAFATEKAVNKFIPIIDHLELALAHANKDDDFCQGIKMIYHDMLKALEELGVTTIENTNILFNPSEHQAISTEEHKDKNIVIKVIQKGYKIKNKVLRTAKVVVSK